MSVLERRKVGGFWWTWVDGQDWPAWYYGESAARDGLTRLVRGNPGRKVCIGQLKTVNTVILPDRIEELSE